MEQAASYREQAARAKLASLSKEERERTRLVEFVQELEEEAAFLENLAAQRETNRQ